MGKATFAENAIAGFKAKGVCPFNVSLIPAFAFTQESRELTSASQNDSPVIITAQGQVTSSASNFILPNKEESQELQKRQ